MGDTALVIFSICLQAAIGIMVFVATAKLLNKDAVFKIAVSTAAVTSIVGLLASFLHLGSPLSSFHALARFGSSWLSREIWFTAVFTALTTIAALLILFKPIAKSAIKAIILAAAIIGFINVGVMASVYHFASVPAWNSGASFVQFYTTMISVGAVLFLVLGRKEAVIIQKSATIAACLAIGVQVVAMIDYYIQLGANSSLTTQQSVNILNSMRIDLMVQWILILVGASILLVSFKNPKELISFYEVGLGASERESAAAVDVTVKKYSRILLFGIIALIIGQIIGRYLFYAVMVVSRVGLN